MCLSCLTSVSWLWCFLYQKPGCTIPESLDMWLLLSGLFDKTVVSGSSTPLLGSGCNRGNVFGMLMNWNSQDTLTLTGRIRLSIWSWGYHGQPRLHLQHAYRSLGQRLHGWDPSDKGSTVIGSGQSKSDETKKRETGGGPSEEKRGATESVGMSQLSHFGDALGKRVSA